MMSFEVFSLEVMEILYLLFPWLIILILLFMTYKLSKTKDETVDFDTDNAIYDNFNSKSPFVVKLTMPRIVRLIFILTTIFISAWIFQFLFDEETVTMPLYIHTIMEIFSVVVSMMFFGIVWHTYDMRHSVNMMILACAFFIAGLIDIAHLLSYKGMPDFITPSGVEKGINFWLASRLSIAIGLLAFISRDWNGVAQKKSRISFLVYGLAVVGAVYYVGIFHQDLWPHTFSESHGLTLFKILAEYTIISILLMSAFLFYKKIINTNSYEAMGFFAAIAITILSELCFVSYNRSGDLFNLIGHMFKVLAYYFIYQSTFASRVRWPFWRINQEISSRKKSEEEASRERDFTNTVFDAAASLIVIIDKQGKIARLNKTAILLTGYTPKDIWDRYFWDIFLTPDERHRVKAVFMDSIAGNITQRYENRWMMRDGSYRLFDWSNAGIKNESGEVEYLVCVGQDITQKRQIEVELNKKRERLRAIFDTVSMGINIIDYNGMIVDCNQMSEKLLGVTKREYLTLCISKDSWTLYKPDMTVFNEDENPINIAIQNKEAIFGVVVGIKGKDSSLIWIRLDVIPLNDGDFLVTFSDISKLKESEKIQREQEKLLMQQAKLAAMGEMVGAIAHQWRQPLNTISYTTMNIALQQKFGTLDEELLMKMVSSIDTQAQKMSSIISDFLSFFKPQKIKEEFYISEVFDTVLEMLERQLSSKNITVSVIIDDNIKTSGFKNGIEQVVLNIIINARDAFESQDISIDKKILVEIKHTSRQIIIHISDNAGGIDSPILERIFEPYFTTKEEGTGTGIGLYMSKLIMQKSFDGDITVANTYEDGKQIGAKFTLTINNGITEAL